MNLTMPPSKFSCQIFVSYVKSFYCCFDFSELLIFVVFFSIRISEKFHRQKLISIHTPIPSLPCAKGDSLQNLKPVFKDLGDIWTFISKGSHRSHSNLRNSGDCLNVVYMKSFLRHFFSMSCSQQAEPTTYSNENILYLQQQFSKEHPSAGMPERVLRIEGHISDMSNLSPNPYKNGQDTKLCLSPPRAIK